MPYVSTLHARHIGDSVDDGHCVAFVRQAAGLPHTAQWRRGALVRGAGHAEGTAIATFEPDGTYGNKIDASSHCAILLAEKSDGLSVLDQWVGHNVAHRIIRFRGGKGSAANDGDQYYAIELRGTE